MPAIHGRQKKARRKAGRVQGETVRSKISENLFDSIVPKIGSTCEHRHRLEMTNRAPSRKSSVYSIA